MIKPLDAVLARLNLIFQRLTDPNEGTRAAASEGIYSTLRSAKVDIRDLKIIPVERNAALENSFQAYEEAFSKLKIPEVEELNRLTLELDGAHLELVQLRAQVKNLLRELSDGRRKTDKLHAKELRMAKAAGVKLENLLKKGITDIAPRQFSKPLSRGKFESEMRQEWGDDYAQVLLDRFEIDVGPSDVLIPMWMRVLYHLDLLKRPLRRLIKRETYDQPEIGDAGEFQIVDGEGKAIDERAPAEFSDNT